MTNYTTTILIVDDEPAIRRSLEGVLCREGYHLAFACNGADALRQAAELLPDLILLDVMMPDMDGFEVCQRLRADPLLAAVPIVIVTALDGQEARLQGMEAGADDFVSKPFDRLELRARVRCITRLNRYRRLLDERAKFERLVDVSPDGMMVVDASGVVRLANKALLRLLGGTAAEQIVGAHIQRFVSAAQWADCCRQIERVTVSMSAERVETVFLRLDGVAVPVELTIGSLPWCGGQAIQLIVHDITLRKQAEEEIQRSHAALALAYDETLEGWARALELRDHETVGHSKRVTELTLRLARSLGVSGEALVQMRRGALLHDIGKMGIPDGILLKAGPLSAEQWAVMRRHPVYAFEMLEPIAFLREALDIPYCHHEKWDGTGYPRGLRGEQIPLAARIFAVVDVWDALCSERPYHPPWPPAKVRAHIQALAGTHFDPQIVAAFLAIVDEGLQPDGAPAGAHQQAQPTLEAAA